MEELNIVPMIADWTHQDDIIGNTLKQAYNTESIPFYVVVPPEGPAITPAPSPLTPGNLIKALEMGAR